MKIIADENIPFVKECFSSIGEVQVISGRAVSKEVVADADILLVRSITKVNKNLLQGSKVRFVATATIGFEHVDRDYLDANKIGFASAPGSNANSVAEYITAGLLKIALKYNITLAGKKIGVVGVGNVGSRVVKKAAALGMQCVLNDPPLQRQSGDAKYRPIEEVYTCDFVTFHTPLTKEGIDKTYHLADERFFKSLKKDCVFFNTSRGGVTDTKALKDAIKGGRLKATVLDVWENEPNIDTELLSMVDVGTPHIAGYSYDGKVAGMIMIYKAACDFFNLNPKFEMESFLPLPQIAQLKLDDAKGSYEEILNKAVEKLYAINEDDTNMRKILKSDSGNGGKIFDNLRKTYRVRREFQNTQIIIGSGNREIGQKLEGMGFQVSYDG